MKNADKIGNVAKQMIGVCNVIINLMEAEQNETYDDIFWDELAHTQKLVLEFTKCAFEGEQEETAEESVDEPVEAPEEQNPMEVLFGGMNEDDAFFAGELEGKLGDKTDDNVHVEIEEEEDEEERVPQGIDK